MKLPSLVRRALVLGAAVAFSLTPAIAQDAAPAPDSKGPLVVLTTTKGDITIQLRPDLAPKHVERIVKLSEEGFYNGVPFHRVIDGFMAQTGDPTGTGTGGSKYPDLKAEFSSTEQFKRGTVGMARAQSPNSANSQFFICYQPAPFLNGSYTIVGQVVSGLDTLDQIKKGDKARNGMVNDPDRIESVKVIPATGTAPNPS